MSTDVKSEETAEEAVEELFDKIAPSRREQIEAAVVVANDAHKQRWAAAVEEYGDKYAVPRDVAQRLLDQNADELRAAYGRDRSGRDTSTRVTDEDGNLVRRGPTFKFGTDTHCSHGHAKFEPLEDGEPTWKICEAKGGKKPKEYCRLCKREGRARRKEEAQAA